MGKEKAKMEAERIAREKEEELQEIYRKQLAAMEEAKRRAEEQANKEAQNEQPKLDEQSIEEPTINNENSEE